MVDCYGIDKKPINIEDGFHQVANSPDQFLLIQIIHKKSRFEANEQRM